MRTSTAALVLVQRHRPSGLWECLARWNERSLAYFLPGGHRLDHESGRDCAVRELAEKLWLAQHDDFTLADEPVAQLQYHARSRAHDILTSYDVEVFAASLTPVASAWLASDSRIRWVSLPEIRAGATLDGRAICPTMAMVLSRLALGRPHFVEARA